MLEITANAHGHRRHQHGLWGRGVGKTGSLVGQPCLPPSGSPFLSSIQQDGNRTPVGINVILHKPWHAAYSPEERIFPWQPKGWELSELSTAAGAFAPRGPGSVSIRGILFIASPGVPWSSKGSPDFSEWDPGCPWQCGRDPRGAFRALVCTLLQASHVILDKPSLLSGPRLVGVKRRR